eukprot:gene13169-3851_t
MLPVSPRSFMVYHPRSSGVWTVYPGVAHVMTTVGGGDGTGERAMGGKGHRHPIVRDSFRKSVVFGDMATSSIKTWSA